MKALLGRAIDFTKEELPNIDFGHASAIGLIAAKFAEKEIEAAEREAFGAARSMHESGEYKNQICYDYDYLTFEQWKEEQK